MDEVLANECIHLNHFHDGNLQHTRAHFPASRGSWLYCNHGWVERACKARCDTMPRPQQMLETNQSQQNKQCQPADLVHGASFECGDCVRSLERVKGMGRTFIGQKATFVF